MTQQARFWTSPKSFNPNPDGVDPTLNIEQGYHINIRRAGTADGTNREIRGYERFDIGTRGQRQTVVTFLGKYIDAACALPLFMHVLTNRRT
jgi:hypothetical protein